MRLAEAFDPKKNPLRSETGLRLRRRLGGRSRHGGRDWRRLNRRGCGWRHPLVIVIAKIPQPQENQQKKNLTQSNRENGKRPDCSEKAKTGQSHKLTRCSPSSHHPPSSPPTSVATARFHPQSRLKCYLCPDRAPQLATRTKVSIRWSGEQLARLGARQPREQLRPSSRPVRRGEAAEIRAKSLRQSLTPHSGMTKIMPGLSFVGSSSVPLFAARIFGHCPEFW